MFQESLTMLSQIHFGGAKSWDILQGMQISIKRFRTLTKKLLELNFIIYDPDTFTYALTSQGENIIKSMRMRRLVDAGD